MNTIMLNSSSDEDDPYANSATRLKKLKKKRLEKEKLSITKDEPSSINIKQISNTGTCFDGTQKLLRSRRKNNNITVKQINITVKERHPPDLLECDVETVSITEDPKAITVLRNDDNDVITLSDDNTYSEDENYEMNVKIFWRSSRIDRLNMHRHDSFQRIFQHYADLEKVSIDEILIMKKDKIVKRTDTPASLKLSIIDILDGGIVNAGLNVIAENKNEDNTLNTCNIKVQTENKKQSLSILLQRNQQFKMLIASCVEQFGIKESELKLYFDGEQIDPTDTPESLDFEEEACVDLHIST